MKYYLTNSVVFWLVGAQNLSFFPRVYTNYYFLLTTSSTIGAPYASSIINQSTTSIINNTMRHSFLDVQLSVKSNGHGIEYMSTDGFIHSSCFFLIIILDETNMISNTLLLFLLQRMLLVLTLCFEYFLRYCMAFTYRGIPRTVERGT